MKKLSLLLLSFIMTINYCYTQTPKTSDTITSKLSKTILYTNALSWVTNSFNSGKAVIDMADKDGGLIIGKGYFEKDRPMKVTIQVKDGKYRYEFEINKKSYPSTLIEIPVTYPMKMFKGVTYAQISMDDEVITIDSIFCQQKTAIYGVKNTNYSIYDYRIYYNNPPAKSMATSFALNKAHYLEWKKLVDVEILNIKTEWYKKLIIDYKSQDAEKISAFIQSLVIDMAKEGF